MNFIQSNLLVRQQLAKYSNTDPEDWFLCLRGRDGLAVVYSAIRKIMGYGEILTTPYTTITSINPILYGKLKPTYLDIDRSLLSHAVFPEEKITANVRAIVMQHTYGIIDDKTRLGVLAYRHRIPLIEDSAHCLTRMARDRNNKIIADISMHSFGAEKVLTTTKIGGAIYINPSLKAKNRDLYEEIVNKLLELKQPKAIQSFKIQANQGILSAVNKTSGKTRQNLGTALTKLHLITPNVKLSEQDGNQSAPLATDEYINEKILEAFPTLRRNYERRQNNVRLYNETLSSKDFDAITNVDEPLLAYPIIFSSIGRTNQAYDLLTSEGFFVRRWYSPLLYPGPKSNRKYHYNPKNTPIAEETCLRVLGLPTDLPTRETQKIIKLLTGIKIEKRIIS